MKIRASSLADLFDCSHRWEGTHLLGMTLPTRQAAHIGRAIHRSTAQFDTWRLDQIKNDKDFLEAVIASNLMLSGELENPDYEVIRAPEDVPFKEISNISTRLNTKYCQEISPQWEWEAVELTVDPLEIETPSGAIIELTGTLDRSRVLRRGPEQGIGIVDLKTGRRVVDKNNKPFIGGKHLQLGVYEILATHTLKKSVTVPATIVGLQTTSTARIGVGSVENASKGIIGTPEQPGLLEMAGQMAKSGLFPPNPNSNLCSAKWCARWNTCKYHA